MLTNPLIVLLVQYMATALILGFTTPTSVLRFAVLPLVDTCSAICVASSKIILLRSSWAAIVGGYSVTYLFQYIALALLSWIFLGLEIGDEFIYTCLDYFDREVYLCKGA